MSEKYIKEMENKKGTYYQVTILYTQDGKRKSRSIGQFYVRDYGGKKTALAQAKKARDQALREADSGSIEYHDITVAECFESSLALMSLSKASQKRHQTIYDQMFREDPDMALKAIKRVTTEDVQLNLNRFAETHTQDGVKDAKTIWHQIFLTAQMKEIPVIDRTVLIKTPKSKIPTAKRDSQCTYEDIRLTLDALHTYGDTPRAIQRAEDLHDIITVMLYTGMRPQEALALGADQIDMANGLITVDRSVGSTASATRQIITTKTADSVRTIPIASALVPLLGELMERGSLFFADADGLPYDIQTLNTLLRNLRISRKLPRVTLYMCRHLFATDVYGMAVNKKAAQRLMGHKSETMTLHYVNDDPEEREQLIRERKLS